MGTKRHRSRGVERLLERRAARINYARIVRLHEEIHAQLAEIEKVSATSKSGKSIIGSQRHFNRVARVLDLLLPHDAAEEAIGNLAELYMKRLRINVPYAKFWLCVQSTWIIYGHIMDLYNQFTRARAGK